MSLKRMLKEEWRMHSRIYRGGSFASFPFMVGLLTAGFVFIVGEYSLLRAKAVLEFLPFFAFFLGLGVGSLGFSSKDAFRNILGRTNYLVYSSRTLPVSENTLLLKFILKDLLYYTAMFLLPLAVGYSVVAGFDFFLLSMLPSFLAGIVVSLFLTRSSLYVHDILKIEYRSGKPLIEKSVLDLERSSGGLFKIVFSLTVLSGFYWFLVLKFPVASVFMQQPLISFGALIGTISITVYNWLNRFDSSEDYFHLPLDDSDIMSAKQKAFVKISFPLLTVLTAAPLLFYTGDVFTALITAFSTATLSLGASSHLFGLKPNIKIYDTVQFLRLLALNSVFVVPILLAAVFGISNKFIVLIDGLAALTGILLCRRSVKKN